MFIRNNHGYNMWIVGKCYGAVTEHLRTSTTKPLVQLLEQHSITKNLVLVISQTAKIQTPRSRNTHLMYPSMSSGALPETFLKFPEMVLTDTILSTYKLSLIFWGYTLMTYSTITQLCEMTTGYRQLTIYYKD